MLQRTSWPHKTRELHNHHMDSTVWNEFRFRDDDIIIGTYAKSGTTWTQQIVSQLLFGGAENVNVPELSPWLDMRIMPRAEMLAGLEAQTNRRFVKTHLPVDALVFSPKAKYLYIVRDARDVVWSLHNHLYYATEEFYRLINDMPGRVGPELHRPSSDQRQFFVDFIENDGYPLWSFWENIRTWWDIRYLPNVMLLHFVDLKANPETKIREIASFLEIEVADEAWPRILEHCSFDYMKRNADRAAPLGGMLWEGGASRFIHKGTNGRWRDLLTDADICRYQTLAVAELGKECAEWLERGGRA